MSKERRAVKPHELLAIDPRALIKSPDAFFWLFGPSCPEPKRVGDTCIVYIRGGLEHHADGFSCSYESIIDDVKCAREGDDPATSVVLAIDSPGGVVSGLYECVAALQKLKIDAVYVEGLCASAAYAIACSTRGPIIVSGSSIVGSVGVIATMFSQARRDKAMGIDVVTITSGKRKADGHPHVEISSAAVKAEQKRVAQFAEGFFEIVEDARGVDPEPYEAGLFVGKDAIKAGFADKIGTLAEFQEKKLASSAGTMAQSDPIEDGTMRLTTLIKNTKAAIAASKDKDEKAQLRLDLATLQRSASLLAGSKKTTFEKETSEEHDDDEEEAEDEESEDEAESEDDEKKAEGDDDADAESEDDDADAESEDDEKKAEDDKEEKKAIAAARNLKGKSGKAILSALLSARSQRKAMLGELGVTRKLAKTVSKLVADNERRDINAVISSALAAGRITPAESKKLAKQSTVEVGAFLSARPKAIVRQNLGPNLKESASMVSQQMGNFAPSDVTAEITTEMREAAERAELLSGGKVKAADFIKDFQASATKETH